MLEFLAKDTLLSKEALLEFLQPGQRLEIALKYYNEILFQRCPQKLPLGVVLTFHILNYLLRGNQSEGILNFVRTMNQIVDMNQGSTKDSFSKVLLNCGLPP